MPRLVAVALLTLSAPALFGGVVFDGSLGKSGPAPFSNSNYLIPASFGKQKGGNLFQSFSQFNLISSESATFTGPSQIPNINIQNILARVTGGPSSIDGTINSDIQGANLFFLNPAGLMFGPHAQLNVSGSVAISTANYLKLADGGRFNASLGDDSMLTAAPVSAFGFLNAARAPISFTGSTLAVAAGKCFSVVAGDIDISGGTIAGPPPSQDGSFSGPGPRVNLVSVGSIGEVQFDATDLNSSPDVSQFSVMGEINLNNSALIDTSGVNGGPVFIRAGNLLLTNNSEIISQTFPNSSVGGVFQGGTIDIGARQSVTIMNGAQIVTLAFDESGGFLSTAIGGDIVITAASIRLNNATVSPIVDDHFDIPGSATLAAGVNLTVVDSTVGQSLGADSGNISLSAGTVLLQGSSINVFRFFGGDSIAIHADDLLTIRGGFVTAGADTPFLQNNIILSAHSVIVDSGFISAANLGNIAVSALDAIKLVNGAFIDSSASDFFETQAGSISVTANSLLIEGPNSGITSRAGLSGGGTIVVRVTNDLRIMNGGQIDTSTDAPGDAGLIKVTAASLSIEGPNSKIASESLGGFIDPSTGQFFPSGTGGDISISVTGALTMSSGARVSASSASPGGSPFVPGSGNAGNITATAGSVNLITGSSISTSAQFLDAGKITLSCRGIVTLSGQSSIESSAGGTGTSGTITITTNSLQSANGSLISTDTLGSGNGGDVSVTAKSVTLDSSTISSNSDAFATGNAGSVMVRTGDLTLTGGSEISSSTFSSGNGGNVNVKADSLLIDGANSGILAVAGSDGSGIGGDVVVSAVSLSLQNEGTVSAASFTSAAAGSVHLSLGTLSMNSGSSISSANSGTGAAGSVSIATTGPVELSQASSISTSAHGGTAGDVTVHTSDLGITQGAEISSSTFGGGSGGDIKVTANSIFVKGTGSAISAEAGAGTGSGGEVNITADSLLLENAGSVSAKSLTAAMAGSVRLALGTLTMESNSSITSANTGSGAAGGVFINATGSVRLRHGSSISTRSMLSGAGNIELISDGVIKLSSESSITASAGTDGGSIHLNAPDLVYLADSSITATAGTNGGGTGGNITIDPHFIILRNSSINASATGTGGNINLISDFLFNSNSPLLVTGTVSSGTVNIAAPQLDLGAELITLPDSLVSAANQLQERCTALLQGDFSSFISIGRGGTEPEPDELQSEF